jgi:hypothetical protein
MEKNSGLTTYRETVMFTGAAPNTSGIQSPQEVMPPPGGSP